MDERPTEDAPQGDDSPPDKNSPPNGNMPPLPEDSPALEDSPPHEISPHGELSPPASGNSPPMPEDSPPMPENSPHPLSAPLQADLGRVWVLGYLDALKGEPVNEDDEILSDFADSLDKLAKGCINHSASLIAQLFVENPQTVFRTVYGVGFEACLAMNLEASAQLNRN